MLKYLAIINLVACVFSQDLAFPTKDEDFHISCKLQTAEPERSKLVFNLYNSQHPDGIVIEGNSTEKLHPYSKKVFIVQGFMESVLVSPWPKEMIKVYLKTYVGIDVIHMDWSYYSQIKFLTASCSSKRVGEILGEYITNMLDENFDENYIHLIGFSLGGQVVGFSGTKVYKATGKKVAKITGLDVVGIGFENNENDFKLTADDAKDVVGIHTNTALNGQKGAFGRIDFYINGGAWQPSCKTVRYDIKANPIEIIWKLFCSHLKAPQIHTHSLAEDLVGYQCDSLNIEECRGNQQVLMGEYVDPNARGIFYVESDL